MSEGQKLVVKYTSFSLISMGVNLGSQWLAELILITFWSLWVTIAGVIGISLGKGIILYLGIIAGTGTGLIVKYILDKKYIFYYRVESKKEDAQKFALYTAMGIITTLIFWGTEWGFHHFSQLPGGKYIGGAIGLTIGYTTKYFLDKRFVFRQV